MSTTTANCITTRRGIATRAVAFPLGGLGTGTIALGGDGSLRQWQIHNQVNHQACVPHSFFAISAQPDGGERISKVLQSAENYAATEPAAPPTSSDHIVPIPHQRLMQKLPGVQHTEFTGEYPIAWIRYLDDELPVDVALEAYNPFVPLDADASAIPAIRFAFTVTNPGTEPVSVNLAATLQNAVGWDGVAPIFDTTCQQYGGNLNTVQRDEETTLVMSNPMLPPDAWGQGAMALSIADPDATTCAQWSNLTAFWKAFAATGSLPDAESDATSGPGKTWNGALASTFTLDPGEQRVVPVVIAWHFPNRFLNWWQWDNLEVDSKTKFWIGNHYATLYENVEAVVDGMWTDAERLEEGTRLAHRVFHESSLPAVLTDTVTSQMSIARTPTCFWAEDGNFYGFEGCSGFSTLHHTPGFGGCCPLNCTHVWNYEMSLAWLYPHVERNMRDTEWDLQQHPSGYLPHRVALPRYLPRLWDRAIGGPDNPALDGLLGAILKTAREYQSTGDRPWLEQHWPPVKLAFEYIWTHHDPDRVGVIEGEQPNTYDISIYGANTFIGTLYIAALRAAAAMATSIGDDAFAEICLPIADAGSKALDDRLWNGSYYEQDVDLTKYVEQNWATGCHLDHLFGEWWARVLGLDHTLDADRLRTAAATIFDTNYRERLADSPPPERQFTTGDDGGVLICTWPKGGRPEVPTRYSDEVWTGLEYVLASLLLYQGDTDRALRIVETTRQRYDGTKQNPWNDIECGDHYVRAMSSWALLLAATGMSVDNAAKRITISETPFSGDLRAPFVAGTGWGQIARDGADWRIEVWWGHLEVATLELPSSATRVATANTGDIAATIDGNSVRFDYPVTIAAGDTLIVSA